MEPRIERPVDDLANRLKPRVVAPGHCTGWHAKAALAHTFAPEHYGPSVVGSLYASARDVSRLASQGATIRTTCIAGSAAVVSAQQHLIACEPRRHRRGSPTLLFGPRTN